MPPARRYRRLSRRRWWTLDVSTGVLLVAAVAAVMLGWMMLGR